MAALMVEGVTWTLPLAGMAGQGSVAPTIVSTVDPPSLSASDSSTS